MYASIVSNISVAHIDYGLPSILADAQFRCWAGKRPAATAGMTRMCRLQIGCIRQLLKVPNDETRTAMAEADEIARMRRARFGTATELVDDLEKNSRK